VAQPETYISAPGGGRAGSRHMYRIELWEGALYFNGRRHTAVCDHAGRRIIVSHSADQSEQHRLEAVARAVRMELLHGEQASGHSAW